MKYPQLDGRKSRASDVQMMTKRSNHMPTFTKSPTMSVAIGLVRTLLNQWSCGMRTLHVIIVQYAQAYCPKARFTNAKPSYSPPEYQAMKNSIPYAYPTIRPVAMMIL